MKDMLAVVGGVCLIATFGVIGALLVAYIRELIDAMKWNWKYKHRFDKSPTAKCYCIDCKYYNKKVEWCSSFGRCVGDSCFCWDAEPRKKE